MVVMAALLGQGVTKVYLIYYEQLRQSNWPDRPS